MKEKNVNKNITRLVVLSILVIFLTTSANSAFINTSGDDNSDPPVAPLGQNYYEWKDDFNNEQLIDMTKSWGYVVEGGIAKMKNTYPIWTDPEWEKMMPIQITSGSSYTNYALNLIINYDPDMDPDYDDIRFKHEDAGNSFLYYWIESYDSSDASVWVKIPSLPSGNSWLYLFYGNDQASSESSFGDVFTDWDEEWANDKQISYHGDIEGAWDSDVAYGNDKFLVAWEEGDPYWPAIGALNFKQEIRGSMFSPSGGDPVVFDKRIFRDDGYTYFRNENPSIAHGNNGKFFVAWEHYEPTNSWLNTINDITTMDIYGRTVQKNGNDFSLGTVRQICTASDCQADANVIFNPNDDEFLVVWEDARDGQTDYDIWGRLYNADGSPSGNEKRLNNDANSQCEPWGVYDPDDDVYFIVFEEGVHPANGPFRIKGAIFDENLNEIDTFTVAQPSNYPNENTDYNFPCVQYNSNSERFLVTWNDGDISDNDWWGNVYGKIYDSSGNVKVNQFTIRSGSFVRTGIVPYLSNAFFVSFDNNQRIFGRLVSSEGDLYGGDVELSTGAAADADWSNIATDGSKIFAVWEDLRINYPPPQNNVLPDSFGNMAFLNIPDGSDITITYGQEKEIILEAQITSKKIQPTNLDHWHQFLVEHSSTITFDILDSTASQILIHNADDGEDLSIIDPNQHPAIRLRAHFTRDDPSYTPEMDWWKVLYEGIDLEPPRTRYDRTEGIEGLGDWFTSECVTVWLKATDYPPDTGSGIKYTYYTVDSGSTQIYNEYSGIHICSYAPDWYGDWVLNFWSVDNAGNVEDRTNWPDNYHTVYIDARIPECWIVYPTEEAEVETPFDVYVDATDNAGVERVDFDIEPYSQRPGLPWSDYTPPYIWTCDVEPAGHSEPLVQIMATAYDEAGQYWIHEVFIKILNWNARSRVSIYNFRQILKSLNLGLVVDNALTVTMTNPDNADSVKFVAKRVFTGKEAVVWDNDLSNGGVANFNIPTGLYRISATTYNASEVVESNLLSRVFFINR
ncbi:MAG: DUF2341 domain-containing protein [Thermoplasmatales archaeon]|nr:DUF2341 domain-containing protein [Thermoplasmatales archaeon]